MARHVCAGRCVTVCLHHQPGQSCLQWLVYAFRHLASCIVFPFHLRCAQTAVCMACQQPSGVLAQQAANCEHQKAQLRSLVAFARVLRVLARVCAPGYITPHMLECLAHTCACEERRAACTCVRERQRRACCAWCGGFEGLWSVRGVFCAMHMCWRSSHVDLAGHAYCHRRHVARRRLVCMQRPRSGLLLPVARCLLPVGEKCAGTRACVVHALCVSAYIPAACCCWRRGGVR